MREYMLVGKLEFPGSKVFELYPDKEKDVRAFWKAIWLNFLDDAETNGLNWYTKLGGKLYNDLIRRLCHNKWVISHSLPGRKWASVELNVDKLLEFVTPDELETIKTEHKYARYLLDFDEARASTLVRQNGETKRTGLVRKGFRDAGGSQFGFDTVMLTKYNDAIVKNVTKSMDKVRKYYPEMKSSRSSYDQVSVSICEYHRNNPLEIYTTGDSYIDSRGRAISAGLTKVFNPIGNKDARSLLVIPQEE